MSRNTVIRSCGAKASDSSPPPRLFDLVLFNHVDHELVPMRIAELRGFVDVMGFAETEYTHSTGERKQLKFETEWLAEAPFAHYQQFESSQYHL